MKTCRYTYEIQKYFDGEITDSRGITSHLEHCESCRRTLKQMESLRKVCASEPPAEVTSSQFHAFYQGILERADAPVKRRSPAWTALSLAAAAMVVAISAFLVMTNGTKTVDATVVESCSSDLEGATVTTYDTADGVTTVWVTVAREDVW